MIYELYSIKDELAGTFGNIMVVNARVAQRTFKWMTNEMDKADCDDKRIYKIGEYDNESGQIRPTMPELAYNIEEEKKHENL